MSSKIYRSSFPNLDISQEDINTYLFANPTQTPEDQPLYIDALTGETRTYGDVKRRTHSLAHGLREIYNIRPLDVVALFSPNTIDYPLTALAVIGCGATVSPVNAASTSLELEAQLETSGAKCLIAHSALFSVAQKAIKSTPDVVLIQADGKTAPNEKPTAEFLASTCDPTPLVKIGPSESATRIAFMCFSSGTTGRAKGVMTSHQNEIANVQQWMAHTPDEFATRTVGIGFLPFSHIYGLANFICISLRSGSPVIVMPRFDLEVYLAAIQKYKPERLVTVPPVVLLLVKDPRVANYDLSSVKTIISAAAPLSAELGIAVEERLKKLYGSTVECYQGWGLTETSPIATLVPGDRRDKKGSVGSISPNMEFRLVDPKTSQDISEVDEHGTSLPGEIWCRGPNVTEGYYRNEQANRDSFAVDAEGRKWFRTGDIATIDNEGFIFIVDRIKEMIKYKAFQVIPAELEAKLLESPDIDDACVVGIWVEEQQTELPVGFVVLSQQAKAMEIGGVVKNIHEWVNSRVSNHKRLRGGIRVIDVIPKSPSGKLLRRELRESLKSQKLEAKL